MTDTSSEAIAVRLRKLREAYGKSQTEFCSSIGLAKTAWNNYETGDRRISLDAAITVCEETGATLDWIYRGIRAGISVELAGKLDRASGAKKIHAA